MQHNAQIKHALSHISEHGPEFGKILLKDILMKYADKLLIDGRTRSRNRLIKKVR